MRYSVVVVLMIMLSASFLYLGISMGRRVFPVPVMIELPTGCTLHPARDTFSASIVTCDIGRMTDGLS